MSRSKGKADAGQEQEQEERPVVWVANADLYPPADSAVAAYPRMAYRAGQRVPDYDVQRFGWDAQVRRIDADEPEAAQPSEDAASGVHPLVAGALDFQAQVEQQQAQQQAEQGQPDDPSPTLTPDQVGAQGTTEQAAPGGTDSEGDTE